MEDGRNSTTGVHDPRAARARPGSLADRITRAPVPHDRAHLAEIAARFADLPGPARELLEGSAGCSPFLAGLILREADWLRATLDRRPEAGLEDILAAMPAETTAALADSLRIARRRAALLIALADLGGAWGLGEVTAALSALADRAVQLGLEKLVAAEIARGKLPGVTAADIPEAAGMFVIAMGKLGARELNYSSDIDLIVLFDETRHDPDDYADLRRGFIRVTQQLVKLLSEITEQGYVFRVDLRLRPDPSVTPVCIASEPAEHYYESLGRTWERAAYIKARPCAGAIAAGEAFLERLSPFIWRRHLDFAAIEDAQDIRRRIRSHKRLTGPLTVPGHDLKLGQGGIRDIEFFTQTRQLIVGGRDPGLRQRETLTALAALADKGWVDPRHSDDARRGLRGAPHARAPTADARGRPDPAAARKPRRADPARRLLRRARRRGLRARPGGSPRHSPRADRALLRARRPATRRAGPGRRPSPTPRPPAR